MKKIRVYTTNKQYKKHAKILEILFNKYVKEHEQDILSEIFKVWKERMLNVQMCPPPRFYGTGVAELIEPDLDKSYGGTD